MRYATGESSALQNTFWLHVTSTSMPVPCSESEYLTTVEAMAKWSDVLRIARVSCTYFHLVLFLVVRASLTLADTVGAGYRW